jgi:2-oxoglutarate ferredoxin oxidoreductase subunit alpha
MQPIVNDVNIRIATINGTGSQSANLILMRSIFNMGIPVAAKNLFPSNIAGLPTWYTVRVHHKGYQANKQEIDIFVVMNPNTVYDDIRGLRPGAILLYDLDMKIDHALRADHINYGIPFGKLTDAASDDLKLKKKVVNMIYVGVLAELLSIEDAALKQAVEKQFNNKTKVVDLNYKAIQVGREYAREHLQKQDPYQLQALNATGDKILIEGNTSAALGALVGGCTFLSWYPITPSSSVCESLIGYFEKFRVDATTGEKRFAAVQAEDEIAAVGMVLGASWAGARSMTATSGPGISLMSELVGYGYFAEIPAVIFDIQRMGPSTGLPTRNSQGDLLSTYYLSHGDTQHILLLPGSVTECYEMSQQAFDLAEQFQTPVFVMSDLDLGMNTWMTDPMAYPETAYQRGKVLDAEALAALEAFERYADRDGDGVTYRTLPGTRSQKAAYFTRGSGHNEKAQYTEKPEEWKRVIERLSKKFVTASHYVPAPVLTPGQNTQVGLLAYGSTHFAVEEALDQLAAAGHQPDYLRVRALPFSPDVETFLANHTVIYVAEQNRDAQMARLLFAHYPQYAAKIKSILHYDGSFVDANTITAQYLALEKGTLAHV